jgi:hypothetical protein
VQLLVADLRHRAIIGLKNQCGLVAAGREMAVQAIVGDIEFAIVKPRVERRFRFVERAGERFFPVYGLSCLFGPETFVIGFGLSA